MNVKWWTVQTVALVFGVGGLVLIAFKAGWPVAVGVVLCLWASNIDRENRDKR